MRKKVLNILAFIKSKAVLNYSKQGRRVFERMGKCMTIVFQKTASRTHYTFFCDDILSTWLF